MQDPFFAVKEEVEHSVAVVSQLHVKWTELRVAQHRGDEFEWTASELLSGLRSIDWDLQDLEDTVSIVEGSRHKFNLDDAEVQARKDFIDETRRRINSMRDEVQGTAASSLPSGFSTKKSGGTVNLGVGAKAKGYGEVKLDEDLLHESDKAVRPMASAAGDEILDVGYDPSPGGRHRRKKLCVAVTALLVAAVYLFNRGGPPPSIDALVDDRGGWEPHRLNNSTATAAALSHAATTITTTAAAASARSPAASPFLPAAAPPAASPASPRAAAPASPPSARRLLLASSQMRHADVAAASRLAEARQASSSSGGVAGEGRLAPTH
mmetsp:Transcript_28044/g.58959  ORF Transcript_28044/g.58959 Transcript_28044/m.58959 type:complete len:323 (+) Transcript_28044:475-1443(+)